MGMVIFWAESCNGRVQQEGHTVDAIHILDPSQSISRLVDLLQNRQILVGRQRLKQKN